MTRLLSDVYTLHKSISNPFFRYASLTFFLLIDDCIFATAEFYWWNFCHQDHWTLIFNQCSTYSFFLALLWSSTHSRCSSLTGKKFLPFRELIRWWNQLDNWTTISCWIYLLFRSYLIQSILCFFCFNLILTIYRHSTEPFYSSALTFTPAYISKKLFLFLHLIRLMIPHGLEFLSLYYEDTITYLTHQMQSNSFDSHD